MGMWGHGMWGVGVEMCAFSVSGCIVWFIWLYIVCGYEVPYGLGSYMIRLIGQLGWGHCFTLAAARARLGSSVIIW